MEATPLASLSLTHVHYDPADPISYLAAWLALVPQALCIVYVTLIWSTREVEVLLMFAGQMGCEALNFALKRLIKEERPKQMNGKGYGMPSSHAQFIIFFSLSFTLFLLFRHQQPPPPSQNRKTNLPAPTTPIPYFHRVLLSIASAGLAVAVSLSRLYLSYHTPAQVLAGCAAGAVSALGWFAVTWFLRREGWVEWGLDSWAGEWGRWRDLVCEEDIVEVGWDRWRQERGKRRRGAGGEWLRGVDGRGGGEGNGDIGDGVKKKTR